MMRPSISAVVLTLDEEINLSGCLESLRGWCGQIVVVDSGSSDKTVETARRLGAEVVLHSFETHARQWNWALTTGPLRGDWVLALDADQRVTPGLREEILQAAAEAPPEVAGYYLPRKQIFRGKWIRHGGYWPKHLLKLFRRGAGWCDEAELLDFRFYVRGETRRLTRPLIEQNGKEREILFWLRKHLRFIDLLAREELDRRRPGAAWAVRPSPWGTPDQRVLWSKRIWYRLPRHLRPFLYFGYRYFLRMGFLDGRQGFLFHFLQGFWLRLLVDIRLGELERQRQGQGPPSSS